MDFFCEYIVIWLKYSQLNEKDVSISIVTFPVVQLLLERQVLDTLKV